MLYHVILDIVAIDYFVYKYINLAPNVLLLFKNMKLTLNMPHDFVAHFKRWSWLEDIERELLCF